MRELQFDAPSSKETWTAVGLPAATPPKKERSESQFGRSLAGFVDLLLTWA